jgi:hypothetical protein
MRKKITRCYPFLIISLLLMGFFEGNTFAVEDIGGGSKSPAQDIGDGSKVPARDIGSGGKSPAQDIDSGSKSPARDTKPCVKRSEKNRQETRKCPSQKDLAAYYKNLATKYDHKDRKTQHCYDTYRTTKNWKKFELCLLLSVEHRANRLPNLLEGKIEAIGVSNDRYNCYGYARDPENPRKDWVGPRRCGKSRPGDVMVVFVKTFDDTAKRLVDGSKYGWRPMPWKPGTPMPALRPKEERFIIYQNEKGFQHGAYQNAEGIAAKMGELGVFKFESFRQMSGPAYGKPTKIFTR